MAKRPQIITIEEHYADTEVQATFQGLDATKAPPIAERLVDLGALRLREMDEAGIDLQVLSHTARRCTSSIPNRPCDWRGPRMIGCMKRCARIRRGSRASPRCRHPIQKRPRTNWNGR